MLNINKRNLTQNLKSTQQEKLEASMALLINSAEDSRNKEY